MSVGDVLQTTPAATTAAPAGMGKGGSVYDKSAAALGQAGDTFAGIAGGSPIYESMNAYLNPYYNEVIQGVTGRMTDQRNQDLMRVGDQAAASGAFGGSRHGLVESQLYDTTNRNIGEMTNQMLGERFNTAAGLGAQDVALRAGAAGNLGQLGNMGFNIGQQINNQQMQQGSMQQQLLQAILGTASGQFDQYVNSPQQALSLLMAAIGADPRTAERTQTTTPGLFDYLSMGAGLAGTALTGGINPFSMSKIA